MSAHNTEIEAIDGPKYFPSRARKLERSLSTPPSNQREMQPSSDTRGSSTPGVFRFLELPPELAIQILKNLDGLEVVRFQMLCKACHELVLHSLELQYVIELYAYQVVEGPQSSPYSTRERLEHLRRWKRALDNAEFDGAVTMEGSRYNRDSRTSHSTFACHSVHYEEQVAESRLDFYRMASNLRQTTASRWTLKGLPLLTSYAFDEDQDLLVLLDGCHWVEMEIYLFTCSSGEQHPDAFGEKFVFDCHLNGTTGSWGYGIHISGDLVGFTTAHTPRKGKITHNEMRIANWKTGEILLNIAGDQAYSIHCAFLDDRHVIVSGVHGWHHLYIYDCSAFPRGRLSLSESTDYAVLICLPEVAPAQAYRYVHLDSHPIQHAGRRSNASMQFVSVISCPVISVGITIGVLPSEARDFYLMLPAKALVVHAANARKKAVSSSASVPWVDWSQETRLLEGYRASTLMHGLRFAVVGEDLPGLGCQDRLRLAIYDFNTAPFPSPDPTPSTTGDARQVVLSTTPWPLDIDGIWVEPVVTSAPCKITLTDIVLADLDDRVILIDDGIIVKRYDHGLNRDELRVYTV